MAIQLTQISSVTWEHPADRAALRALPVPRLKNLLRYRLHVLNWRVLDAARLDEFVRQLQSAGPDRHPALSLPDGWMGGEQRALRWRGAA